MLSVIFPNISFKKKGERTSASTEKKKKKRIRTFEDGKYTVYSEKKTGEKKTEEQREGKTGACAVSFDRGPL